MINICIFRLRRAYKRQTEFKHIVPAFFCGVICLLVATGRLKDYDIDIVQTRDEHFNDGMKFALFSGICLGFVGRIT